MPADRLGLPARAAMLVLMAEGQPIGNVEMKRRYGFTIVGTVSQALVDLRLATRTKGPRGSSIHELTDAGWAWCRREQGKAPGAGGGAMGAAAYALLHAFLRLADVPASTPPLSQPTAGTSTAGTSIAQLTGDDNVGQQIRRAYAKLADRPKAWVSLTDLRPLVSAGKTEVDQALRDLLRDPDVTIVPESNQKALSAADRAAAVRIGDQDKHLIMIEA